MPIERNGIGKCEVCGRDNVRVEKTRITFPNLRTKYRDELFDTICHCERCMPRVSRGIIIEFDIPTLRALDILVRDNKEVFESLVEMCKSNYQEMVIDDESYHMSEWEKTFIRAKELSKGIEEKKNIEKE